MTLTITEQKCSLFIGGYETIYISNKEGDILEFTASTNASNLNFFNRSGQKTINTSNYIVNINGINTNQAINSLTFAADDKIIIKKKNDVKYFPLFYCSGKDYIKSIDAPLPLMSSDFTNDVTSFNLCFQGCSNLTSIPTKLFKYNTNVTIFNACFSGCSNLTSIPEDIFIYNTNVTNFNLCFLNCSNVTSALPELWISHPSAEHVQCFNKCTKASNYADAQAAGWV